MPTVCSIRIRLNRLCAAALASGSIRLKRTSKDGHRLKQSRQPLQISNTRCTSPSRWERSQKRGLSYAIPCGSWDQSVGSAIGSFMRGLKKGLLALDLLEALREPAGVRLLRLGQGLEPLGDLAEPFFACLPREPRVHLRVLIRFAGDGGGEVLLA